MIEAGEFGLIEKIRKMYMVPEGFTGIGDDCAVIPQKSGEDTLVSSDMLIEGVHFLLDSIGPWQLGWKSAAVNISDIAAMGGTPVGSFLSFALPGSVGSEWMDAFLEGYGCISNEFGIPLLGGDTTSSPERLCISVTVLGRCKSGQCKRRNAAKPGDMICVTGPLGDSAGGLKVILAETGKLSLQNLSDISKAGNSIERLVCRHFLPWPRIKEGKILAGCKVVHAMMDISDGIGSDLRHILSESDVGAVVDVENVPVSDDLLAFCAENGLDAKELAICGGEDYELLFTAEDGSDPGIPYFKIGHIVEGDSLIWKGTDKDYMGFKHF